MSSDNNLAKLNQEVKHFKQILRSTPDNPDAHHNLANLLGRQGSHEEAIEHYKNAIQLNPSLIKAYNELAIELNKLNRPEEAATYLSKAVEIAPENSAAFNTLALTNRVMCDWNDFNDFKTEIINRAQATTKIEPFNLLSWCDDPKIQHQCALSHTNNIVLPGVSPLNATPADSDDGRIRVGYISRDFRNHVVAQLTVELFELHNREKFEVFGFAPGETDDSVMRKHLVKAFDHFIEVGHLTDSEIATLISEHNIHILVDLNGYSMGAHPRILAMRPAPVQVNYLGYIGTMGADFIDYIIVDNFSVPEKLQPHFTERLFHLPCYMTHDRRRTVSRDIPTRSDVGLPDEGFVYCCFNNSYKITPQMFDIWMRCLSQTPASVLWLMRENAAVETNLRKEAQARGIDPGRLVFAPRMNAADHLARQRLADLFLDTSPVNAGATACDALWIGLPLLTCPGNTFVSRMAGGLVHAAGLPELAVDSLEAYETLAVKLANEPELLQSLSDRLIANRSNCLLFDSEQLRDNIEAAYITMWQEWCDKNNRPSHQGSTSTNNSGAEREAHPPPLLDESQLNELIKKTVSQHQQGNLDSAEKGYRTILEINPQQADALQLLGVVNAQRGNINRAVTLYERAIEANPRLFPAYNNLGSALYSLGRHREAAENFRRAAEINPNAESYYNLGNSLYELEQYEEAISNYRQALAIDPDHANAMNNMNAGLKKLGH